MKTIILLKKTSLIFAIFILINFKNYAQISNQYILDRVASVNDTSYLRVFNGMFVQNNYQIKNFNSVNYINDKKTIASWGIITPKQLMIIEVEKSAIEDKIDKVLYADPDFISNYKYPWTIQLPIAINGKLLSSQAKRGKTLSTLNMSKIKSIKYWDTKKSMERFGITPFGVINIKI